MSQATEVYSKEFDRVFLALPVPMRQRIEAKIRDLGGRLAEHPHLRLQGREEFKLRVGDYRVIYEFSIDLNEIHLLAMGHRREIYR